jgi:hypothetical protein
VAGHIFQARLVWIYTQSNITNIIEVVVLKNFDELSATRLWSSTGTRLMKIASLQYILT